MNFTDEKAICSQGMFSSSNSWISKEKSTKELPTSQLLRTTSLLILTGDFSGSSLRTSQDGLG